jgi:signal transduction histidine kinase
MMCLRDRQGTVVWATGDWRRALGWDPEELIGRRLSELSHPDGDGGGAAGVPRRLVHRDGSPRWVAWQCAPAGDDTTFCIATDVTDTRDAHAARASAERANAAKSEFLTRMSHELRTPLNAIIGFGHLLAMADLGETERANVEQITAAGRHLLSLIDDVLDMARIESGQAVLVREAVAVVPALEGAVSMTRPLWEGAGVEIVVVPPIEELHVSADGRRLNQVLLNLVSNAVKYNHRGGRVRVTAEAGPVDRVTIRVADTGRGIDPAEMDKLYQPFQRLGAERTQIAGTGLGLAVTRALLEAMNGIISIQSTPGSGTEVTVMLDRCHGRSHAGDDGSTAVFAAVGAHGEDRDAG